LFDGLPVVEKLRIGPYVMTNATSMSPGRVDRTVQRPMQILVFGAAFSPQGLSAP
jgi:hypothetical protein